MTTRGQINSNFYQIVDVDSDGNPTQVKPEYVPAVSHADTANVANVANSVAVGNVVGIGNIATINLNGNSQQVLNGVGDWIEQTGGGTPGGSNTQVQYNSNGAFAGSSNLTFNSVTGVLAATKFSGDAGLLSNVPGANVVGNVSSASYAINAGNAIVASTANTVAGANVTGYVPNATHATVANTANIANSVAVGNVVGLGNIATVNLSGNGSQTLLGNGTWGTSPANVTPGGANSYVQYNANGVFAGSADLQFAPHPANVEILDPATLSVGSESGFIPTGQQGGKIRFVSPLTYSTIQRTPGSGLIIYDSATGGDEISKITLDATTVHIGAGGGNVEIDPSISNVSLGNVDTLHIGGGTTGQVLTTDGTGNLSWSTSGGVPAGSSTEVQYNIDGAFAASPDFTYDPVGGMSVNELQVIGNIALGGDIISPASIALSNVVTPITANVGQMFWDTSEHTVTIGMENGVQQQVGLESYVYVKASAAITNGQVVMFTGANGDNVTAAPANAASAGFKSDYIIGIATQDIALNSFGYITVFGKVHGLNTNSYNIGDILWYNPASTTGGLTNVQPTDPQFQIEVAAVTKKSAGDGHIQVRVTAMTALNTLTDVTVTTPTTGQALIYNGANVWINGNPQQANIANVANSVSVANVVGIGNIATVNLNGSASQVLYGNGVFANVSANISANFAAYAGNVTVNAQPNITSLGTLTSLNVSGNISGANIVTANYFNGSLNGTAWYSNGILSNTALSATAYPLFVNATANGYMGVVKSTALTADLQNGTWTATTFNGNLNGNATYANSANTANSAILATNSDFVYNLSNTTNTNAFILFSGVNANGYIQPVRNIGIHANLANGSITATTFVGNVTGNVSSATTAVTVTGNSQPNITSLGTLTSLSVTGNITSGNIGGGNLVSANFVSGNGSLLSSINGANVTGVVANATYATTSGSATTAGTVTTNAQPNITSIGTLTSLNVTGNITSGNISGGNLVSANYISGNGSLISSINGSNVTGVVANATYATTSGSATTAGTVTTNAQPNITSTGTLTGLTSTGVVDLTSSSNVSLGLVGNIHITGGTSGYVLSTDGAGTLSWIAQSSGGTPGGANTYVQFNDGGVFNGVANLTFDKTTNTLTATNFAGDGSQLTAINGSNVTGVVANATYATISGSATTAVTVTANSQSNITSTGTLTGLTVDGVTNLGPVGNINITGGSSGYVLSTNGSGNLSWVAQSGGGSTTDFTPSFLLGGM